MFHSSLPGGGRTAAMRSKVRQRVKVASTSVDRWMPWIPGLVMTNIAMENGPFIIDLPIQNGDFL